MTIAKMIAYKLDDLERLLAEKHGGARIKIGHNTWAQLSLHGDSISVIYHTTPILVFDLMHRSVLVRNSGWITTTTSGRLHDFLRENCGASCGIKGGAMYVTAHYRDLSGATKVTKDLPGGRELVIDLNSGDFLN